jgi:hypothetical protein
MTIKTEHHSDFQSAIFENRRVGEWLSSADASRFLGISANALRIMVCRGKVRYSKLGTRLRFHIRDLNILLRKGD